jgi:hypothetical protein
MKIHITGVRRLDVDLDNYTPDEGEIFNMPDMVIQLPNIGCGMVLPSSAFMSFDYSDIDKFYNDIGNVNCMINATCGELCEYALIFNKEEDLFVIIYSSLKSTLRVQVYIRYSLHANEIHRYIDAVLYGTQGIDDDFLGYRYEPRSKDVRAAKLADIQPLHLSEYRDILSYIKLFLCNSCSNNVGMSVRAVMLGPLNNLPGLRISVSNYCCFELGVKIFEDVKANITVLNCLTNLKIGSSFNCSICYGSYDILVKFTYIDKDNMSIDIEADDGVDIMLRTTISLIEHGDQVFTFINKWIELLKEKTMN